MSKGPPSADDFAEITGRIDNVEAKLAAVHISDTPPAIRWLQKWWWKASLMFVADHIGHEVIVRILRWHR